MPEQIQTTTNNPPSPAAFPACDYEGCDQPAVYQYTWDWGQTGFCCGNHAAAHMMNAPNLQRQVQLSALTPSAPVSMPRDERINLHAQVLAAGEEVAEVKSRNVELYNANVELGRQLRLAMTEVEQLKSMIADREAELDQTTKEKMLALKDLAAKTNELVRLEGILKAESAVPG